jgi:hypothetical protein
MVMTKNGVTSNVTAAYDAAEGAGFEPAITLRRYIFSKDAH